MATKGKMDWLRWFKVGLVGWWMDAYGKEQRTGIMMDLLHFMFACLMAKEMIMEN